jgi:hypothetical protein
MFTLTLLVNEYQQTTHFIKHPAQTFFHPKRPHTITKMNDNINMDSTIAGLKNARS